VSAPAELDVRRIVRLLSEEQVDFVVIGAIAAILHGSAANTFDLDVAFATDTDNLARLGRVLAALDAKLRGVADDVPFVPDAATLRRVEVLTLSTTAGDFDVLARPKGITRYATLRDRADVFDIDGARVRVASIEDLLVMKRAAGRDKDLGVIGELEALLRLRPAQDG